MAVLKWRLGYSDVGNGAFWCWSISFNGWIKRSFTDLVKQENKRKVNGFTNFASYVAMGIGMLLGNYIYVSSIPQMPFYMTLGLVVPELLIIMFLIHEPKDKADTISTVLKILKD
ncbi:MAG: hypothetical protein QG670_519 [Thermoproteota archaeon]|nr:hypothetical protein [Thermoproteota archaeon]